MRTPRAQKRISALTLIEIMVVVMIMGMIAAVVGRGVLGHMARAKVDVARAQIGQLMGAIEDFYVGNSFFPTTEQGLDALIHKPTSGRIPEKYRQGEYWTSTVIPDDPWDHPYEYFSPTADGRYEIISRGADGVEGGEGNDADISSTNLSGKK